MIKSVLRGRRFEDVADLPVAVQQAIIEIPVNSYRECFLSLVKRCRKCVDCKGHYYEGEWHGTYCAPMCFLTMMERTFHTGAPGRAI